MVQVENKQTGEIHTYGMVQRAFWKIIDPIIYQKHGNEWSDEFEKEKRRLIEEYMDSLYLFGKYDYLNYEFHLLES